MKQMPDTVLVVDIEATCWEKPKDQPAGEKNEIIVIGIVPISLKDLSIGEPKRFLIKPTVSKISKFCTRITSLTQEDVDEGLVFKEVCKELIEKNDTQKIPWVSWGDYDRRQFLWQCESFKSPYPFGAGHWNFKETFAKMMGLEHDVSLPIALKLLGMEFEGKHHEGSADAINIARVMIECFRRMRGINGKEENREEENREEEQVEIH